MVLDSCTNVNLHGPTTFTYTQAQFPFAQATITAVTDSLHYTIQVRGLPEKRNGKHDPVALSNPLNP